MKTCEKAFSSTFVICELIGKITVAIGEIACGKPFLLLPQCILKALQDVKCGVRWYCVKGQDKEHIKGSMQNYSQCFTNVKHWL